MKALLGLAAAVVFGAGAAGPAAAQSLQATLDARREAMPGGKRSWQETWLLPAGGVSAPDAAQVRKFAGRVVAFQDGDRERLELRAARGNQLDEPVIVVSDGDGYWLVTRVGANPLAESAKASDPWLALVVAGPPGEAPAHREVPAPDGGVAAVVVRSAEPADFDADEAFALKLPQGSGLIREGLARYSPGANPSVTAAAGTRGVGQVRTANGTITVTPDAEAVQWMEAQEVPPVALESFRMEGRLEPYDALPEEAGT